VFGEISLSGEVRPVGRMDAPGDLLGVMHHRLACEVEHFKKLRTHEAETHRDLALRFLRECHRKGSRRDAADQLVCLLLRLMQRITSCLLCLQLALPRDDR